MAQVFISHSSLDAEQAKSMLEWLQGHGFTNSFLDFDKYAGFPPGSQWERMLYREIDRAQAIILILTKNWFSSKWCFAEYTQARALGNKKIFPVIETSLSDIIASFEEQAIDLVNDRERGLERLAKELEEVVRHAHHNYIWNRTRPPYPGLMYFDEPDAAIFFGRDDYIDKLTGILEQNRRTGGKKLILVLGTSGSGKSSLLRAGLVPFLKQDERHWLVSSPFRPQSAPLDRLALALAQLGGGKDRLTWQDAFRAQDPTQAIGDLASDLLASRRVVEAQILITVDQAEELFSVTPKEECDRFLSILDILLDEKLPFFALMGMRSDYLGLFQDSPFGARAAFEPFSLKPMPIAHVRDIIKGPADLVGIEVDDELITAAMIDAKTDDALPLLAFALRELYELCRDSGKLTLQSYRAVAKTLGEDEDISPLENAVRQKAEEVLGKLQLAPRDDRESILKQAFLNMVQVSADGEYVRRRASFDELPPATHELIYQLRDARLLVMREQGKSVEVAHEALLRKWPRLRSLLKGEKEFLSGKTQLQEHMREWRKAPDKQKNGALLSGLRLTRAQTWLLEKPQQLSSDERMFIEKSLAWRKWSRLKRLRNIAAASLLPPIFVGIISFCLYSKISDLQQLTSQSQQELAAGNGTSGIRLAFQALRGEPPSILRVLFPGSLFSGARQALFAAVQGNREKIDFFGCGCGKFNSAGTRIVTVSEDNTAQLWDNLGQLVSRLKGHKDLIYLAAFSDDSTLLVTASADRTARVWDGRTGNPLAILQGHIGAVYYAAFDRNDARIVTGSEDATAALWDISKAQNLKAGLPIKLKPIAVLGGPGGHTMRVRWAEFSPDGTRVVTTADDGTARIWDVSKVSNLRTGGSTITLKPMRVINVLDQPDSVYSARFNPAGTRIVTASSDKTAKVWDASSGRLVLRLSGHHGSVRSAVFSADGNRIVTASDDSTTGVWNANTGFSILLLRGHTRGVRSAVFNSDGTRIVTASYDGTAQLWDATDSGDNLLVMGGHSGPVYSAEFGEHDRSILTASEDGTTRMWRAAPGPPWLALHGHSQKINSATFNSLGSRILTASDDGTARVWDLAAGESQILQDESNPQDQKEQDRIVATAFTRDNTFVTVTGNGTIAVWDPVTRRKISSRSSAPKSVHSVTFTRDGSHFAVLYDDDGTAQVWDSGLRHGSALQTTPGVPTVSIHSAAFSHDGAHIVTGSNDGTTEVWDVDELSHGSTLPKQDAGNPGAAINSAEFSLDGSRIVVGAEDGTVRVWDDKSRKWDGKSGIKVLGPFKANDDAVELVGFGRDASQIMASSDDEVHVWALDSGHIVPWPTLNKKHARLVVISSDGSRMLVSFNDNTARVMDTRSGELLAVITGPIDLGEFSPDTSKLVAISEQNAAVWQLFPNLQLLVSSAEDELPKQPPPNPQSSSWRGCPGVGTAIRVSSAMPRN